MVYDWFCLIILGLWIVANVCQCSSHPFSIHENSRGTSWNISGQRPAVPEESMGRNVFEIEVRTAGRPSIFKTSGVPGVFFLRALRRVHFSISFCHYENDPALLSSKPRIPSPDRQRKKKNTCGGSAGVARRVWCCIGHSCGCLRTSHVTLMGVLTDHSLRLSF